MLQVRGAAVAERVRDVNSHRIHTCFRDHCGSNVACPQLQHQWRSLPLDKVHTYELFCDGRHIPDMQCPCKMG